MKLSIDKLLGIFRGIRRGNRKLCSMFSIDVDKVAADDRKYIVEISNKSIGKAFVVGYVLGRSEVSKLVRDNIDGVDDAELKDVPEGCSKLVSKLVDRELKKAKR